MRAGHTGDSNAPVTAKFPVGTGCEFWAFTENHTERDGFQRVSRVRVEVCSGASGFRKGGLAVTALGETRR